MTMMTANDLGTNGTPLRRIPDAAWLREFMAPAEEVVYERAGMHPPYWAPIGAEVPPAHRIPLHLEAYRRYIAQGRNQMTAFPSQYYATVAARPAFVQAPYAVYPVEFESEWTPSDIRMLA
jgi:hypothetical protein